MQRLVTCADCGLKYGVYSTFHLFPDEVEKERRRHNCRLIQLCRRWEKLVRGPFYWDPRGRGECDGDPPDAEEQAALVDAEDRAAVARAVFEARTAAYTRAEARACAWTFASARASREASAAMASVRPPGHYGYDENAAAAFGASMMTFVTAMARAADAERAARRALADVAAKAVALDAAMDAVAASASEAGVFLPSRDGVVGGEGGGGGDDHHHCGRIVFADVTESDRDSADSDAEDDSDEYVMQILNGNDHGVDTGNDDDDDDYRRGYDHDDHDDDDDDDAAAIDDGPRRRRGPPLPRRRRIGDEE